MTSNPFVRRTLATFRSAEFGFLGVVVYTRVQTPRRNGLDLSAGDFSFLRTSRRLRRTSWLIVGMKERKNSKRDNPVDALPPAQRGRERLGKVDTWSPSVNRPVDPKRWLR